MNRKMSLMALAALLGFADPLSQATGFGMRRPPKRRHWNTPHQGAREMARRRGGADWVAARNESRELRGLPPLEWSAQA